MKIRKDFVTNSSSASFIVDKKNLTEKQKELLLKYMEIYKEIFINAGFEEYDHEKTIENEEYYCEDYWKIKDVGNDIEGWTIMDNGDMKKFMNIIEIDFKNVEYEDDDCRF